MSFYGEDLAHVHHVGFGGFATDAAPALLGELRRAGWGEGLVVDLGCGSGLLARALLDAGYGVLGVDLSPGLLRIAREVAPGATFLHASLHAVEIPPCVAVFALGESLSYLDARRGSPPLEALFARIWRALEPGGLLLFDVVLRSPGDPMRYRAERSGAGWSVRAEVEEIPRESLLVRRIRTEREVDGAVRRSDEVHHVRTFSRAELERALRRRGFRVAALRSYGAAALPARRLAFRARKPRAHD